MVSRIVFFGISIVLFSCVDYYEFEIKNDTPTLVVEGFISNKSYNDTRNYPSDGRFFTVKLKHTGNVTNRHDKVVPNANIRLIDSDSISINYVESIDTPGTYFIADPNFSAIPNKKYKLQIILSDGESYESSWEQLVDVQIAPMGEICLEEVKKKVSRWKIDEYDIAVEDGVYLCLDLPVNENNTSLYYRWDFEATWIFIAPMSSIIEYDHKCWVTNKLYLSEYSLKVDNDGGYRNQLIYMSLYRNERIFEKMSILTTQQLMSEPYYRFWLEMKKQSERGGLFDAQPYNLQSNIKQVGNEGSFVSGYFGIVREQAVRTYISKNDISFYIKDYLVDECSIFGLPAGPDCFSCLDYSRGTPTVSKPFWWED